MGIKLIKKNNEGFTPDAIKRFTVDDPNYVDHIIIPDKKNGDDVIVKIVRGTKEHPLFSGTMYYGRALRSSATEPFSTGMGSLKLMADFLDNLAKQDPEESLADLDAIEQRAKSEKREGATGSVEIKEGPQEGDLIYTPAAQSVAEKLGDDLLMAILAAASDEAWSQADEYEWKGAVDTDHDLEWNTCQALGWGFDDMGEDAPFKGDGGKVYSGDEAKNAYNAIAALADDDRYSLFFNNQPRNYSHIRDVVATAMDMAAEGEDEDESKRNEAAYSAIKNPGEAVFIIDCGSPEKAKALFDAFSVPAEKVLFNDDKEAIDAIGRDIVQFWNVGPYFTACVDPCDKAAAWCENWLRNSDGAAPGIQGNDAGLESNGNEELSPKMQKRRKWKSWQDNSLKMKGFEEAGYSFLDLCHNGGYTFDEMGVPTKGYDSEEEALASAKKIFDDFDEYLDVSAIFDEEGGPDGEAVWFPSFKLKDSFADLPEGEGLEVLSELSDVLYRMYTKGEGVSEDRRGTDRYGHSVRRLTTKDLTDVGDDDAGGSADSGDKFGLAYMDTTSIDAFSNNYDTGVRDRFLHDLAQMPVSKKSIEDLLRKYQLHRWGRPVKIRDFFPENGIAYLGTMGPDGLPYKSLYLKWGPALKK